MDMWLTKVIPSDMLGKVIPSISLGIGGEDDAIINKRTIWSSSYG